MEEKKEFKQFGTFEIPKDKKSEELNKIPVNERSRGSTQNINTDKTTNIQIGKGVVIHLDTNEYVKLKKYTKLDYLAIVQLDKDNGNMIEGFTPPLYKEFIIKNKLLNHVNIGDLCIINPKYEENTTSEHTVKDIYFKSLNNMTVLIAKLSNGELILYNRLVKCK